ncbi:hypothetical protein F5890DRAFT_1587098 [Lentinula detonsa]|uniref:Uncharacterized protein n=1 Tax=Lentinula detonsa TaxID=2804962 RepID=A0AA38PWH5_9AGAR|nr:hypothetical protein F5890DRAFT_1587098 [Lentinula detonsa]
MLEQFGYTDPVVQLEFARFNWYPRLESTTPIRDLTRRVVAYTVAVKSRTIVSYRIVPAACSAYTTNFYLLLLLLLLRKAKTFIPLPPSPDNFCQGKTWDLEGAGVPHEPEFAEGDESGDSEGSASGDSREDWGLKGVGSRVDSEGTEMEMDTEMDTEMETDT